MLTYIKYENARVLALGIKMFRKLSIAATLAILMSPLSAYSLEIASSIATISSASTDGTPSASVFELSVQSSALATGLTTTTDFSLSLTLRPQASDLTKAASVYTVIVANNQFFKLEPDGSYAPWNGALETLTPFSSKQILTSSQTLTLLDGTMAEAGDYLYYAAYSIEGETRLHFTPEPAQILVKASTELPNNSASQAAITFENEIETAVVQARCIACHVEGGLARNSALQFQRTNAASALNNFGALSTYVEKKGSDLLLAKIAGEQGHAGGVQLASGSEGYQAIQKVINEISQLGNTTSYSFGGSENINSPRQASFFTGVTLEPMQATLRRASLMLQGRIPTDAEKASVFSDATLRVALRRMMSGPAFRQFVVTSVNDRLLTKGTERPINESNTNNFLKLHNKWARDQLDNSYDYTFWESLRSALRRSSGELVAYVIENGLPYSEILTAEYMMMNPSLNNWLEGTATFTNEDSSDTYKPSVIQGYYFLSALENKEDDPAGFNDIYAAIAPPVMDYPHAGLLSDVAFLSRYPTTATNRNRARARWTLFHFLGIDVEKSSQRPTDEAALGDKNNPTMNNPSCTVCHALLDPVAGAFQNWGDNNFYRGTSFFGTDALDHYYKNPQDGSDSFFQDGDLWYRDMRAPALFGTPITERENTLQALAELIVAEPLFLNASASFWWAPIFGKPLVNKPTVEADNGYSDKLAAYRSQQEAIQQFSDVLAIELDAKSMLIDMFLSPWFGGETVESSIFERAHFEAKFGSEQLLTPEQLSNKTNSLTGVSWRNKVTANGDDSNFYDKLGVLLGGIDSEVVTKRATGLTPAMSSILMTHATESACVAVARQFAKTDSSRSLLSLVQESTLPLSIKSELVTLPSEHFGDWRISSLASDLAPGSKTLSLAFVNPYCDFDGQTCAEQRLLYIDSLTITAPSGKKRTFRGDDSKLFSGINDWGGLNCTSIDEGYATCVSGSLSIDLDINEKGLHSIDVKMSAQIPPTKGGFAEVLMSLDENENAILARTENSVKIKNQISGLFEKMHGSIRSTSSEEVSQVYEFFLASLISASERTSLDWRFENCDLSIDGLFLDDHLEPDVIETFRTRAPNNQYFLTNWEAWGPIRETFIQDPFGTKYAWTVVMIYMMTHYDYLHE